MRLTLFSGCLAIVKFAMSIFGITLPLSNILFEGTGYSLVNDNNFYSIFFVISVILSNQLLLQRHINKIEHLVINVVAVINIVVNISRRAYVLYVLVLVIMAAIVVFKKYDCVFRY